jgi:peptidoglycan/xylan/chitin deacetylase (PgdA/CDA1 family)
MPFRRLPSLLLCLALSAGLTSCDRVKAKIKDILREHAPEVIEPPKPVLTPEEEAMNKMLENPDVFEDAPEDNVPKAIAFELNKSSTVSILGYHDYRESGGTPMIISVPKFREQMEIIRESKIPVIPLSQVIEWKKGRANIPQECLVITIDDGWLGVHTHAFPILKEFGFPFTIYLYKNYVNIGGRSMTWAQIKEMMQHGCEVGSHSVSHKAMTQRSNRSEEEYQAWLISELKDSKDFLETNLPGSRMTSFAYPFGNHNDAVADLTLQLGYDIAVTVNSSKVAFDSPNGKLGRYIIHGDNDSNFKLAMSFRSRGGEMGTGKVIATDQKDEQGNLLVELLPPSGSVITDRQPIIQANLSRLGQVMPESVKMRLSGFGLVPFSFDPQTFIVSYRVPIKLRRSDYSVTLSFKRAEDQPEEMLHWSFKLDLAAAYLPPDQATAVAPVPNVP